MLVHEKTATDKIVLGGGGADKPLALPAVAMSLVRLAKVVV